MATIHYKVTFFSDWHCGSGLSSGSESDNLVIKDKYGLPLLPGKTIKGLLKDAACDLYEGTDRFTDFINACFGQVTDSEEPDLNGNESDNEKSASIGSFHYSSARLSNEEVSYLRRNPLKIRKLYRNIPSTRISEITGVAENNTLRTMQATIPLTLGSSIHDIPDTYVDKMTECIYMVKRLGYKRNRGFGRCRFDEVIVEKGGKQ